MRLLVVAEDPPNRDARHGNGSSMIAFELLTRLPADVDVTLVTWGSVPRLPDAVTARCAKVVTLPERSRGAALAGSVVSRRAVGSVARTTRSARARVRALSAQADVTLLHGPHVMAFARSVHGPVVAQVVDPWSTRTAMEAGLATGGRAAYLRWRARRALAAERRLPPRARLLAVSTDDARRWAAQLGRPVTAVPNGIDRRHLERVPPAVPTVCFVGSLDYPPNVDSARRLVRDVAPLVWTQVPDARFLVVGRRPGPGVQALASERVEVRGDVPSVAGVLAHVSVAAFADRAGVGTRNSVQEALAAGLPVVATTSAARGVPRLPQLTVADDDAGLAAAVVAALQRPLVAEDVSGLRTWQEMTDDYLRELRGAS